MNTKIKEISGRIEAQKLAAMEKYRAVGLRLADGENVDDAEVIATVNAAGRTLDDMQGFIEAVGELRTAQSQAEQLDDANKSAEVIIAELKEHNTSSEQAVAKLYDDIFVKREEINARLQQQSERIQRAQAAQMAIEKIHSKNPDLGGSIN